MSPVLAGVVLLLAAILEAGGDALVRHGLAQGSLTTRLLWYAAAAVVLFSYGWVVNAPKWEFGRLLGIYIALFFVVAQLMAWLIFGEKLSASVGIGGALILLGAGVIFFGRLS